MVSAESFWTSSLRAVPEGESITRILAAALSAVEPGDAVSHFVSRDGDLLAVSDRVYDLRSFRRVILLGIGKASLTMSKRLATILGSRLSDGLVVLKHLPSVFHPPFTILQGDHPLPGERSL